MSAPKREKIKSSAFSDFMRNASDQEKSEFFTKVAQAAIEEERKLIAKAQSMNKIDIEQHDAERIDAKKIMPMHLAIHAQFQSEQYAAEFICKGILG